MSDADGLRIYAYAPAVGIVRHDGRKEHIHQRGLDFIARLRLVGVVQIIQQDEHAEIARDRSLVDVEHRQVSAKNGLLCARKRLVCVEDSADGAKGMAS